jgi:hypothetical protein
MRSHGAALSGNLRRPGTLSRFADLHPVGFDLFRDRQDPPTETLRTASISGLGDRFSSPNRAFHIAAWKSNERVFGLTEVLLCGSGEGMGRGDRDIAGAPRLRRTCPWGTPWPVPAEQVPGDRRRCYEQRRHCLAGTRYPAGMEQGGGGFPRGQVRCEDRPGSRERSPLPT